MFDIPYGFPARSRLSRLLRKQVFISWNIFCSPEKSISGNQITGAAELLR